jgi:hypothetical protein
MPEWLVLTVGIVACVIVFGGWLVSFVIRRHRSKTTSISPEDDAAYRAAVGERTEADRVARDIGRGGNLGA